MVHWGGRVQVPTRALAAMLQLLLGVVTAGYSSLHFFSSTLSFPPTTRSNELGCGPANNPQGGCGYLAN